MPPVPAVEEDEFLSMLKQQANILHQLQQQRGLAPVRSVPASITCTHHPFLDNALVCSLR